MSPRRERPTVRIRDPIHGTIHLSREETHLLDSPAYQRLRMIKQLGLADLAFPGATHTRYAHGLGTLHIAARMFSQLTRPFDLPTADAERLRSTVRLAAMFHDLGHAPLSHTTESFMPPVGQLELGRWQEGPSARRASHEDYTLKILLGSELTQRIEQSLTPMLGVTPDDVASLIAGRAPDAEIQSRFRVGGLDFLPMLRQCVSSELDADRMDYLLRDSYYAGVPYGRYDLEWLLENLQPVERDGVVYLGLDARAAFGFEDFLLSRYHMFTSVYLHQIPIGYEVMLSRYYQEQTGELVVPGDVEGYLGCDDIYLWNVLRHSPSIWARRIVDRRAYRMLLEDRAFEGETPPEPERARLENDPPRADPELDLDQLAEHLRAHGIDAIVHHARGRLSKYYGQHCASEPHAVAGVNPPLFVVDGDEQIPVERYSPLYRRYAGAVHLRRLYVEPEKLRAARALISLR